MLYPQSFIDDLKNRADIVRLIERSVPLKKKGANWMACCPFHEEKTPSFSVHQGKGMYKCFGCGKGGNIYTFLMEFEGLSFPEAIKRVAEESGVELPQPVDDQSYQEGKKARDEKKKLVDQIIELNDLALDFWQNHLYDENPQSKAALDYLQKREIDGETLKKFRIGFAPDSWDTILTVIRAKGADEELIKQSGLISVNEEKNRIYDRFRGRIIFPVLDVKGKPVAFGARGLGDEQPKYLNSPETPAYIKGEHLYGFYQNREEIRRKKFVILVEGYMDLLALYQFGIRNVVASLGTALTDRQAKLMARFARKVVVNYDGDSAGVKAARRAIETLLAEDIDIKILVLPDGADPDDFIRANGVNSYNLARGNAHPFLQFVLDQSIKERNLDLPRQKAEAIGDVLPMLGLIQNPIQKRESFDQAMNFLRLDDTTLKRDLWNAIKHSSKPEPETLRRQISRVTQAKMTIAERNLLTILIHDREVRDEILPQMEATDYEMLSTALIFEALFELLKTRTEVNQETILALIANDTAASDFVRLAVESESPRENDEARDETLQAAENCLVTLRSMAISHRIIAISRELTLAQDEGDSGKLASLLDEQIELARMKQELAARISGDKS